MRPHNTSATINSATAAASTAMAKVEDRQGDSSCYYPGCRKDANCSCEMCLASISATLDLMSASVQRSSMTKLSTSSGLRPNVEKTPVSFDPSSAVSTPKSTSSGTKFGSSSPDLLKSTARMRLDEIKERKEYMEEVKKEIEKARKSRGLSLGGGLWRFAIGLALFLAVEAGFSSGVCWVLRPVYSSDVVRSVGEKSLVADSLSGRLRYLQSLLKGLDVAAAPGKFSNCSYLDSNWEINQDGVLLRSRCVLYKSSIEEVSIWGWPLQTAGLLRTGFSSRSFTVLSGRVTEWADGRIGYSIHRANASWEHQKWGASVVQLDPKTWILEYRRSSVIERSRLLPAVLELLGYKFSAAMKKIKTCVLVTCKDRYLGFTSPRPRNMTPT